MATRKKSRRRSKKVIGKTGPAAVRRMLMNVIDPNEIRMAIMAGQKLEDLYIEQTGGEYVHGNIYKGRVQNIQPSLQAAFVDIGGEKNGFLHASDVIPPHGGYDGILKKRRRKARPEGRQPPIEEMLYKGQEVLVQITRESLANKGPSVTTYVSLPGRYLVLMPAVSNKRGVSRKITSDKERQELRRRLEELDPPKEYGLIIRTAGMGRGKVELKHDLSYLLRLWDAVIQRTKRLKAPAPVYQESDLVIRAIRDYLYEDVEELLIDREEEYARAKDFLHAVMPSFEKRTVLYQDKEPLFHKFGVEDEIEKIVSRSVRLPGGGEIVIEQTEAMVTIDVNSGRFRSDNTREMILTTNEEAARESARQLRFRDLGGLIVIDFIDMELAEDRQRIEEVFREATRRDRARTSTLSISALGILEMTRQRVRKSLRGSLFTACPACAGTGLRKSPHVFAREVIRRLRAVCTNHEGGKAVVFLHPEAALSIANSKRAEIRDLEIANAVRIIILADASLSPDDVRFEMEAGVAGGGA